MTFPTLSLNPALDVRSLAAAYARDRFVQVPDFFEPEAAEAINSVLRNQMSWRLVFAIPGQGTVQLTQAELQSMGRPAVEARLKEVMTLATRNIGYCYSGYPMIEAFVKGIDPGHPIHEVTRFLNSPAFLEFGEAVIGHKGLTKVDAQATLFTKGNFLTRHIDEGARRERRAAYTLGFSQNWQTDWGGLLMFIDQVTTEVTSGHLPRFNTLTIFDGLRVHSVSVVSQFAGDGRYSIVGWLRDDPR
ncbi:MAG: 2OG-Fe(II) oxygenase [Pannonibacter sp.]